MIDTLAVTIAIRHIISRRRQTILSVLAVALAVSISVIFTSLVTGQQQILTDLVEEKLPHVVVKPEPGDDFIHLYKALLDRIGTRPGIKSHAASLSTIATLSRKDKTKNALLKGSDPLEMDRIYKIGSSMVQGDLGSIQQTGSAAIGRTLAENLDIKLGDKVSATFPSARATDLTVAGIFFTGTPLDEKVVFVSLKTARNFRDIGEENQLMGGQESMIYGNFSDLIFNKRGAFLGVKLAESLKIRPGGDFYLYFKNNSVRLKVIGLLKKGTVKDETQVYISLDTSQELIGQGDVVSEIGVKLANFANAPALALEMNGKGLYKITSWQDFSKEIARFVGNQNVTNMLFYIFILSISAFVIANTTIMVVSRRKKEIGILMAMGADRSSILKIFLLENMLISVPAGALGCLLGLGLARMISLLPLDVTSTGGNAGVLIIARPKYFAYAMVFALALNLISGIYPAYSAARLDPVEAITSE